MKMKKRIKDFLADFWATIIRPEMAILPGQLAFFLILSVVPTITLIAYSASALNLSINFIVEFLEKSFSSELVDMLTPMLVGTNLSWGFFIFLFIGFFIASNGCTSIIYTSNAIYGVENGNYIKIKVKAVIMTIILVLLFLFILIVPVFGDKIVELINFVNGNSIITDKIIMLFKYLNGPVTWLVIFLFIKIIYTMAPTKKVSSRNVNYGAIFTTVFWVLSTGIYSYYINHFAHYDIFYANLANIVVLMLWVYLLAFIFVIGMALNCQKQSKLENTGEIKKVI